MGNRNRMEVLSIKDLMQEMGFNPKAPVSTQSAFMRNLIKAAYNVEVPAEFKSKADAESEQLELFAKAS